MDFLSQVLALPEPRNYFTGQSAAVGELPDNILLFCRRTFGAGAGMDTLHHRYVLVVCLESGGDVCLNEKMLHLEPGQGVLIFPHQLHHYLHLCEPLCWLFITFELHSPEPWQRLRDVPASLSLSARQALATIVNTYLNALGEHSDVRSRQYLVLHVALLLHELLAAIPAAVAATPKSTTPATLDRAAVATSERSRVIDRVNRYIYEHLDRKLLQADIARHAGVSASHLRLLVRTGMGISLGHYVKRVQINRAAGLLVGGRATVGEVAAACGFASIFAFSRAFRRLMGCAPGQYRRRRS